MSIEYHCKYDELVEPDDLEPHPKNANMHPEEQIDALSRFIRVSGFRQPVTVSKRSDFIVAGHARKVAAKRVGCKVPVVYQEFETEVDEIAYLLADNRLAELSITDDEKLQSNLDFLDGSEFEIGDIGFDICTGDSEQPSEEVDVPPVDYSTGKFFVEVPLIRIGKLIESLEQIEGIVWERKK